MFFFSKVNPKGEETKSYVSSDECGESHDEDKIYIPYSEGPSMRLPATGPGDTSTVA